MNNKVGIYYAFWEQEWDADFIPYVKRVSKIGFDVLEINAGAIVDMTAEQRKTLAKAAEDNGVELTYCIGMPKKYDMSSLDDTVSRAGIEYFKKILNGMYEMNGHIVGGILYSSWPTVPDRMTDKSPWWNKSIASMREISKTAENCGVTCCMEVVNRFENFLMNTAEEAAKYVKEVGSENIGILLDAFHMNIEEDTFAGGLRAAGSALKHFHIGETNRRVPGRGHMPWGDIFDGLKEINYSGRIVMEPFLRMGGQVGSDIRVWRDLSNQGGDDFMDSEAKFALDFVRNELKKRG